jgi:hypothetical protein
MLLKTVLCLCAFQLARCGENDPEDPIETSFHEIRSHVRKIQTSINILDKLVPMVEKYVSLLQDRQES